LKRVGGQILDAEKGSILNGRFQVRYAIADLEHLRDRLDETVPVIIWGVNGPTVLRTVNSMHEFPSRCGSARCFP
jgi:hypothetical protein